MDQNNPTQTPPNTAPLPGAQQPPPTQTPVVPSGQQEATPPQSTPPASTEQPQAAKPKKTLFLILLLVLALVIVGGIFAYAYMMNNNAATLELGAKQDSMQQATPADVMLPEEKELEALEVTDPATELQELENDAASL